MVLGEAYAYAKKILMTITDEAALEAALFLEHITGLSYAKQLAYPELDLSNVQQDTLLQLVHKRIAGIPLQYLTGHVGFMGLDFMVSSAVLIPRPDTELLVEQALSLLGIPRFCMGQQPITPDWNNDFIRILDIGTGSGCIPISLLVYARQAGKSLSVTAVDLSEAALEIARQNAVKNAVQDGIQFSQIDILQQPLLGTPYHLILSNPPYIPTTDIDGLMREVRDKEPYTALDGGADGLTFYRHFAHNINNWLLPNGVMLLEVGIRQAESVAELFQSLGFRTQITLDIQKIGRVVAIYRTCF